MTRTKMRRCKTPKCRTLTMNKEFCDMCFTKVLAQRAPDTSSARSEVARLRERLNKLMKD
jgi:ubiquinone biosynthesis protein UbiJ